MDSALRCNRCLGSHLRPSRLRWWEYFLYALMLPWRCHTCGARFLAFRWRRIDRRGEVERAERNSDDLKRG